MELSEEKTLITHALSETARFLGYELTRFHDDTRRDRSGRHSINGDMSLRIPAAAVRTRCQLYLRHGKPMHRAELLNAEDYTIVSTYQSEYRGYVQYYLLAHNIHCLNQLRWTMLISLLKTLAAKHKTSVNRIATRYKSTVLTPDGPRRCFEVKVERKGKRPLIARFGGIPLKRQRPVPIQDVPLSIHRRPGRTELLKRLLKDTCELCGSTQNCEVHHVRKLAHLQKPGRCEKPAWMKTMIARRRKTLVVCHECHWQIHRGRSTLEPSIV